MTTKSWDTLEGAEIPSLEGMRAMEAAARPLQERQERETDREVARNRKRRGATSRELDLIDVEPPPPADGWLPVAEAAKRLGVAPATLRGACKRGEVKAQRIGRQWRVYVATPSIEQRSLSEAQWQALSELLDVRALNGDLSDAIEAARIEREHLIAEVQRLKQPLLPGLEREKLGCCLSSVLSYARAAHEAYRHAYQAARLEKWSMPVAEQRGSAAMHAHLLNTLEQLCRLQLDVDASGEAVAALVPLDAAAIGDAVVALAQVKP